MQTAQNSHHVVTFCCAVLSRHTEKWPLDEDKLADEFVAFFSVGPLVGIEELLRLCQGFRVQVSLAPLPEGLHAINGRYGENRAITLADREDFPGGKIHTLLHELRELMEYQFRDQGFPTAPDSELDSRAEDFASEVRIKAGFKVWIKMFEEAGKVESNWKRWLAYAAFFVIGMAYAASCALLPQLEDAASRDQADLQQQNRQQ